MQVNLIQSYIANQKQAQAAPASKTADTKKDLDNRAFLKPLPPKGKLIRDNIFLAPFRLMKDVGYKLRAVAHGINGTANDHELGATNDVGMLTGGAAIAAYLFSKKTTPVTKCMEILGPLTFFSSMALWPKLAIQWPTQLIHGFNPMQKYKDSQGRIKPLYQDPQFVPMELYSDKRIKKLARRWHLPKNMPNKRAYVEEKMKKIALQDNTLWMYTAGPATPIMTALLCNKLEKVIANHLDNIRNNKADDKVKKFYKYVQKEKAKLTMPQDVEKLLKEYRNKPIDDALSRKILDIFKDSNELMFNEVLDRELQALGIKSGKDAVVTETTAKRLYNGIQKAFKDYDEPELKKLLFTEADIQAILEKNGLKNKKFGVDCADQRLIRPFENELEERIKRSAPGLADDIQIIKSKLHKVIPHSTDKIEKTVLTPEIQDKLLSLTKILTNLKAQENVVIDFFSEKLAQAPETVLANLRNDMSDTIIKELNFSKDEIKRARVSRQATAEILSEKLEKITSNEEEYTRFIEILAKRLNLMNSKFPPADGNLRHKELSEHIRNMYQTAADEIDELTGSHPHDFAQYHNGVSAEIDIFYGKKMDELAMYLNGQRIGLVQTEIKENGEIKRPAAFFFTNQGSRMYFMQDMAEERLLSVKSDAFRWLNVLDTLKRIPESTQDKYIINLSKKLCISGSAADFFTKFDCSDKKAYQKTMKMLFDDVIHPKTHEILDTFKLKNIFYDKYRKIMLHYFGNEVYFPQKHLIIDPKEEIDPTDGKNCGDIHRYAKNKFISLGLAPDEFVFNGLNKKYNSEKWLKMFGVFGAVLLAGTITAQFFFGKSKNPYTQGGKK